MTGAIVSDQVSTAYRRLGLTIVGILSSSNADIGIEIQIVLSPAANAKNLG